MPAAPPGTPNPTAATEPVLVEKDNGSGRPPVVPRTDRAPVVRSGASGRVARPAISRAPVRAVSAMATTVDYSYLRGDLRRIAVLSISLLFLLIVLNLLLNH
jgi:hypothetical protein